MTETGLCLGTPAYMSPEQASGDRPIDARSDIFALGCVLYEMLAGEPPFTGPTLQAVMTRVLTGTPESVATRRRDGAASRRRRAHARAREAAGRPLRVRCGICHRAE